MITLALPVNLQPVKFHQFAYLSCGYSWHWDVPTWITRQRFQCQFPFFPCQILFSLQQMSWFPTSPSNSSFKKKSTPDVAQNKLYFQLLFLKLLKIPCKLLHSVYVNFNGEPRQLLNNAMHPSFTSLKANNFFLLQCSINVHNPG